MGKVEIFYIVNSNCTVGEDLIHIFFYYTFMTGASYDWIEFGTTLCFNSHVPVLLKGPTSVWIFTIIA